MSVIINPDRQAGRQEGTQVACYGLDKVSHNTDETGAASIATSHKWLHLEQ